MSALLSLDSPRLLTIQRKQFFDAYRAAFGSIKSPQQVKGIEFLLDMLERDADMHRDIRWAAYLLATIKHECADTWHPIEEYGKGRGRKYGNPVRVDVGGGVWVSRTYYGRGFVQLTWHENYRTMDERLGLDGRLIVNPALACDPETAYGIASIGMREGRFTGKKLADYIAGDRCDYKQARRIINGLDKAQTIAIYATAFEKMLRTAVEDRCPCCGQLRSARAT